MQARYGPTPTADQQREFAWDELQTTQHQTLYNMQFTHTPNEGGINFTNFEGPKFKDQRAAERGQAANAFTADQQARMAAFRGTGPAPVAPPAGDANLLAVGAPSGPGRSVSGPPPVDPAMNVRPIDTISPLSRSLLAGAAGVGAPPAAAPSEVNIGTVTVHTQARDADAMAADLRRALDRQLVDQANRGLQ